MPQLLKTVSNAFLRWMPDGSLGQTSYVHAKAESFLTVDAEKRQILKYGTPVSDIVISNSEFGLHIGTGELFYCAEPGKIAVLADRRAAGWWETFFLVDEDAACSEFNASITEEMVRFKKRVEELNARGEPVKIYFGPGTIPKAGFLNVDIMIGAKEFAENNPHEYFIFPFADQPWNLDDNCVDYISHEDFIEHISQLQQIQFLAEAWRVMKHGACHRVNTPNLIEAMERHSVFRMGYEGVYAGEVKWGHICLFSPASLTEMAELIGYKKVVFTKKSEGTSPYAIEETRPGHDRDEIKGAVLADLFK